MISSEFCKALEWEAPETVHKIAKHTVGKVDTP